MKILVFLYSLSMGGAERATVNLANHWVSRGYDVTIVTIDALDRDFYILDPRVKRLALNLAGESKTIIHGVINNFRRVQALRRVLLQELPDVALGMMTTANCLLALASLDTRVPALGWEQTHPPMLPLGRFWEWLRRETYGLLQGVAALTIQTAEWLKQHTRAKRVVVIPNPVSYPLPIHEPVVPPIAFLPKGKKVLLSVGRLAHEKGFDNLIMAFSRLASLFPDWILSIVGDGPEFRSLKGLARKLGVTSRVFFPGRVGNLHDWYTFSDLYVMSSRYEGFGNTLVEAMAYGLPVVSTDCEAGPREIIRHGIDGFLVPPNDVEALASALANLMKDEELRKKIGLRAVEVRERFGLPKIAGMWEQLFKDVMYTKA